MSNQEIFELMARFDASAATSFKLTTNASAATSFKLTTKDFSLELGKGGGAAAPVYAAPAAQAAAPAAAPAPVSEPEGLFITAPLVGTFYAASAPDAAPYVQVGDKVKKGQTVCLMEDCVIEAVLQQDGALVSFGEPLIRYREG